MTLTLTHLLFVLTFLLGLAFMFIIFRVYIGKKIKANYIDKKTIKRYLRNQLKYKKPIVKKRGLFIANFTWLGAGEVVDNETQDYELEVTNEITVVEETADKYKIKVDESNVGHWTYGHSHHMDSYRKAFSGWYNKTDSRISLFKDIADKEITIANIDFKYTSDGTKHFFYKSDEASLTNSEMDDLTEPLDNTGFKYEIKDNHLVIDVEPVDVLITYIESATENDYMNL